MTPNNSVWNILNLYFLEYIYVKRNSFLVLILIRVIPLLFQPSDSSLLCYYVKTCFTMCCKEEDIYRFESTDIIAQMSIS